MRRLEYVLARAPITSLSLLHEPPTVIRPTRRWPTCSPQAKDDDGQSLIDKLVQDHGATRREASIAALERCKELYQSPQTRYLSARCFTGFMAEHGDDADVVEGHLLIGILRMDYANDYPAAKLAFERFLERAPGHPDAELARYRLWLANTERGAIHEADRLRPRVSAPLPERQVRREDPPALPEAGLRARVAARLTRTSARATTARRPPMPRRQRRAGQSFSPGRPRSCSHGADARPRIPGILPQVFV
jgi:hypothetical protein